MIDPFTIVTFLSSYATGLKITGLLSDLSNGKNIQHFNNGVEYSSKGIDNQDLDFLQKAISEFDYINETDDRLFVVAWSYLFRAVCYTCLFKFSLAYYFLDKLEAIDYNFFTRKKDTIEETKKDGRSFRNEVKKLEKAYLASINVNEQEAKPIWKKVLIISSIIIVAGVIVFLFFL